MTRASRTVITFIPEFKWRTTTTGKGTLLCTEDDYHLMIESLQHNCMKKPGATVYIEICNLVRVLIISNSLGLTLSLN